MDVETDVRPTLNKFWRAVPLALLVTACIPQIDAPYGSSGNRSAPQLDTDPSVLETAGSSERSVWQTRPVTPNARSVAGGEYVVQAGDTLRGISNKTGAASYLIAQANGIEAPYIIKIGQKLTIPGGRYHRVSSGETGIAIARAYGVRWAEMVSLNDLEEPYVLRVGQALLLPSNAPVDPSSMTLEQRASAFDLGIDDIVTGGAPAAQTASSSAPRSDWRQTIEPLGPIAAPAGFNGRFVWPAKGRLLARFGDAGGGRVNDGINIALAAGSPVRAAAPGVVAYAGNEIAVFGGLVLINHGSGWVTAYGHAAQLKVRRGDKVKAGDVIALAGETGYVTEPQLHFEIRKNRNPVDPAPHLGTQTAMR